MRHRYLSVAIKSHRPLYFPQTFTGATYDADLFLGVMVECFAPAKRCASGSILTLPQVLDIFDNLDLMRRTMALTDAATALRVSEVLALKWNDLDFIGHLIQVRRAYVDRRFGPPKSKASKAPVPMHPLLAAHLLAWRKETLYPGDEDFVFPSLRLKGKKPPAANMLVADYLRVAARKAGVIAPPRTFGFHTFRRTLASVLVKMKVDVKTVQEILRTKT